MFLSEIYFELESLDIKGFNSFSSQAVKEFPISCSLKELNLSLNK